MIKYSGRKENIRKKFIKKGLVMSIIALLIGINFGVISTVGENPSNQGKIV